MKRTYIYLIITGALVLAAGIMWAVRYIQAPDDPMEIADGLRQNMGKKAGLEEITDMYQQMLELPCGKKLFGRRSCFEGVDVIACICLYPEEVHKKGLLCSRCLHPLVEIYFVPSKKPMRFLPEWYYHSGRMLVCTNCLRHASFYQDRSNKYEK